MSSNAEGSERFHLIPTEVIEAWAKGEYYSGDAPSLSYRQLGAALSLRGWYTYEKFGSNDPDLRGVAKIDLKGQNLVCGGIRLYSPVEGYSSDEEGEDVQSVRFWRSQYSYFYSENEIVWVYLVYHNTPEDILKEYFNPDEFPDVSKTAADGRFGFDEAAWGKLLQRLRSKFDSDMLRVEEGCTEANVDKVLLHYNIDRQKGEYRALYHPSGENISGMTSFKRLPGPRG